MSDKILVRMTTDIWVDVDFEDVLSRESREDILTKAFQILDEDVLSSQRESSSVENLFTPTIILQDGE